jgi:hypothetical protein
MRQLLTIRHSSPYLNGPEKTTDRGPLVFVANMNGTLVHYNEAVERGFVPGAVVSG